MSTRNRKKCFWRLERGRRASLTSSPPSVTRLPRQCRILNTSQPPQASTGSYENIFIFYSLCPCYFNARHRSACKYNIFLRLRTILWAWLEIASLPARNICDTLQRGRLLLLG
jgi:hypothetical protein